jgi:CRP-like cAMP-binding protein
VIFTNNRTKRLRSDFDVPLFGDCTPRELRVVDGLGTVVSIEAGRVMCRRGDIGHQCFVILDGQVDVDVDGQHHTVGRGAVLGEIALLIANGHRTATVTARSDLEVLVFSQPEFMHLMTGLPAVSHKILREATRRLVANSAAA